MDSRESGHRLAQLESVHSISADDSFKCVIQLATGRSLGSEPDWHSFAGLGMTRIFRSAPGGNQRYSKAVRIPDGPQGRCYNFV